MTIEQAEQFEEQELYDKVYAEYKKLLDKRPNSVEILQRTAHVAKILGLIEDAEKYFSKIVEEDKANIMAYEQLMDLFEGSDRYKYYTYRGNLHVCQGQLQHAAGDFKKALEKAYEDDQRNMTRFVLAGIYTQLNKDNQAIDEYLRLIDSHEAPLEAYTQLSKIYMKEGILSSAAEILERAINDGHDNDEIKNKLADIYIANNQTGAASKVSSDPLVQLRCLIDDEKMAEAKSKIDEMQDKYKKNPKFLSLVAQYYYTEKKFDEALEAVNEFAKFDKNSPLIYQMRALIYEEKGDSFNEHYNWAKYNLARGNKDVALNEYMFALQQKEDDKALLLTIAELLDDMNDKTHAIEFYERLSKVDLNNKKALERLGEFRESIGDYKMAIEYFEKLYCLDNRKANVLKSLAVAYEKTKNLAKAVEFYNKYLSSSAISDQEVASIKKKLEKLEGQAKTYNEASMEDEGLIDKIMRFFNK